jgi:hypothetical protein
MVDSKPKVSFDQTVTQVPKIMDGSFYVEGMRRATLQNTWIELPWETERKAQNGVKNGQLHCVLRDLKIDITYSSPEDQLLT